MQLLVLPEGTRLCKVARRKGTTAPRESLRAFYAADRWSSFLVAGQFPSHESTSHEGDRRWQCERRKIEALMRRRAVGVRDDVRPTNKERLAPKCLMSVSGSRRST